LANYTLNFDNAYADCLNVTLINFKANADCIEYAFSITQITLNISKTSYSIYIANSNTRICTQSNLSAYSNSFDIAITQGILNISGAELSIFSMALIAQAYLYQFSIANSKALSIYISIGYSWTSSNTIYSFESYGVSVGFDFDNSKASVSSIAWFILMILLLQILKHFLLLLQLLILRLLVTLLLGFISIVRVYVWGPPYTTAPPCNVWGNAPVDDS
jgi:hypothetical protein